MSRKEGCESSHPRILPFGERFGRPSGVTVAAKHRCVASIIARMSAVSVGCNVVKLLSSGARFVLEVEILRSHCAVLATTHSVAIAREPPVKPVGEWTSKRNFEQPRNQPAFGQHFQ